MEVNEYFSKKRVITIFIICIIFLCYLIFSYAHLAFNPPVQKDAPQPMGERGSILDRKGKPLAIPAVFYNVGISPASIKNVEAVSKLISRPLGYTSEYVEHQLRNGNENFFYLKKRIDKSEYDEIRKITQDNHITQVSFEKVPGRIYPENNLASQVIGFMGSDGNGLTGIELTYNSVLSPVATSSDILPRGKDVYLTIDANLQYKLEKIAQDALEETQAESFMLIAADAKTGEILSYISLPSANLSNYTQATEEEKLDRPSCYAYEPGSVFKIFSVASFLTAGAIKENDTFVCDGKYTLKSGKGNISIACLSKHGRITAEEALKYSCNDAIAQMSEKIPAEMFLDYISMMGFGKKTGIELPGETKGSVKTTSNVYWSARSKPTMAMGQELSVSALQMVQATTAIANKGVPVKLTLISRIRDSNGNSEYEHKPQTLKPVFSESAANYLLKCMETTAKEGTGSKAYLADIPIGVKTGTAQMPDLVNGGYSETDFLSNCMSIFPVDDPKIILYIVITKAKGETYAGRIVAPVIKNAANTIIDHFGMNRASSPAIDHSGRISIQMQSAPEIKDFVPDLKGYSKQPLLDYLSRTDIIVRFQGEGYVSQQNPPPGTPVTENMVIDLYFQ